MSIDPQHTEPARAGWIVREPPPAWELPPGDDDDDAPFPELEPVAASAPTMPAPSPAQRRCDAVARLDELEAQLKQLQADFYGFRRDQRRANDDAAVRFEKLGLG